MSNLIQFTDVQGDTSFVKASAIDGIVIAQHEVPSELDENGQPIGDKKNLKFFAVAILRNGRQVLESFDTAEARDKKVSEVSELL